MINCKHRRASYPSMLVPFPIACFVGALITDIAYWRTANMMWSDFSSWLIATDSLMGGLAALTGSIDFIRNRAMRMQSPAWPHMIGNVVALVLALFNAFVHSHDAWTSVVPSGLILSAVVVAILLFTGWMGWSMVYPHRLGVAP